MATTLVNPCRFTLFLEEGGCHWSESFDWPRMEAKDAALALPGFLLVRPGVRVTGFAWQGESQPFTVNLICKGES